MSFEQLPRSIRMAIVSAYGYRNAFVRYGAEFRRFEQFLNQSAQWISEDREAWQRTQLRELLLACRRNVPAHGYLDQSLIEQIPDRPLYESLAAIRVTEKQHIRAAPEQYIDASVRCAVISSTSGTSGSPMTIGHDRASIQRRFALLSDHLTRIGTGRSEPSIRFSGRIIAPKSGRDARPWLHNPAENQVFLSTYHLDDAHGEAISRMVEAFQPAYVDGYPSAILALLRLLRDPPRALKRLRAIVTTAETLDDTTRSDIERLSGVRVHDYYAASEGVSLIQQCRLGIYHVRWQSGIFEVLTPSGVSSQGDGELVCTSFVQRRTPLIRYRTGDVVTGLMNDAPPCGCGLHTPIVQGVLGRVEDQVVTADGRLLGMFSYRTLKDIGGLKACQIIQHEPSAFTARVVLESGVSAPQVFGPMKASFERVMGHPVSLTLDCVDEIERGPNGKFRAVKCNMNRHAAGYQDPRASS